VESEDNKYSEVVIKGIAGCSSTDKDDDDPTYQSIKDPPSPPPRYSTVEDGDPSDLVFHSGGEELSQKL
jgi:hypothetical protein